MIINVGVFKETVFLKIKFDTVEIWKNWHFKHQPLVGMKMRWEKTININHSDNVQKSSVFFHFSTMLNLKFFSTVVYVLNNW